MTSQDAHFDFIGREREITIYDEWLNHPDGPWILYFHDAFTEEDKKGGIGKTWLLQKCEELTRKNYPDKTIVRFDFFNVEDRNGVVIAERVIEQLKAKYDSWSPSASETILTEHREARQNGTDDPTFPKRLANAIENDLAALDRELQKTGRYLLLFYDTFEIIDEDPIVALLDPTQKFPDNYQFPHIGIVMAGRNALPFSDPSTYWYEREQEVLDIALGPFSPEEMVAYINVNKESLLATQVTDSAKMVELHKRTEGRPILIGLAIDIVNNGILTLEALLSAANHRSFEEELVSKILDLEQSVNWIILFMAHACHRFNAAILDWMLCESDLLEHIPDIKYQDLQQKLPTLSFIRHSTTGNFFVLHDEMRRLVMQYCWPKVDPHKENRKDVSNCMIKYYEQALGQEQNKSLAQSYTVEMLYHKLFVNLHDGLQFFEQLFENALKLWLRSYARSLLQEVQRFDLPQKQQHYRLFLLEARLLAREEKPDSAVMLYQYLQAETDKDWFEPNRSTIYWGMADCFQDMGDFSAAIDYALKSLEIEQRTGNPERQAELLGGTLGYSLRRQGRFDDAVEYYKQALDIYKQIGDRREYADKMNSLGNVYRIQGKIDEALRCCQIALHIREDLLKEEKVGEIQKGLSLSTIGQIYLDNNDVLQAEVCFQEAAVLFQRSGYKRGMARTYNRLGRAQEIKGDLDGAMDYFQRAYQAALNVDKEEQIGSLNKQGRVLMRQKSLARARELFEQARELADQTQDHYQQVEALLDLAHAFENSRMHDQALQALERGRELALEYHYNSLLGVTEILQGVMGYESKDYNPSFDHFIRACHYMALFNSLRYKESIRLLTERLLKIPKNSRPAILSRIRTYWSENGLETMYPELIQALKELEDLDF